MKTRTPPLLALVAFLVVGLAPAAWTQASTDPSLVFDKIEAMVEMRDGVPLPTDVYVPKVGHRFRKGHRLMVQVQSTWFPGGDGLDQQNKVVSAEASSVRDKGTEAQRDKGICCFFCFVPLSFCDCVSASRSRSTILPLRSIKLFA